MSGLAHGRAETGRPVVRYRITPWPVRILIPVVALVLIAGIAQSGTAPAVLIPVVVAAAIAYLLAAERVGLYCSARGLDSRMTRRTNSFRYSWSEIDRFEVVERGAQLAIVVHLRDGSQRSLPSTKAWGYQRSSVTQMCDELNLRARTEVDE